MRPAYHPSERLMLRFRTVWQNRVSLTTLEATGYTAIRESRYRSAVPAPVSVYPCYLDIHWLFASRIAARIAVAI